MHIEIENRNSRSLVTLSGEFTIYSAVKFKQQLVGTISECESLEIELSNVSEFDSAGLQLLALLKREADALGRPIRFSGHSASVREVLNLCELNEIFDANV